MFLREIQLMGSLKRAFTGAHNEGASGGGVSKMLHLPCLLIVREEHPVKASRRIPPKAPQAALTPQPEPPLLHIQGPFTLPSWCVFLLSHPRPHCCVVGNDTSMETLPTVFTPLSPRLLGLYSSQPAPLLAHGRLLESKVLLK